MAKSKSEFDQKLQQYTDLNSVVRSGMPSSNEGERRNLRSQREQLREDILSTRRRDIAPPRKIISLPKRKTKAKSR